MRALLALAVAMLLAGCGSQTERRDWPPPSPALWEVTAPSGERGWIFGTVHALPDGIEWHTPVLDRALDEAQVLVVEVANLDDSGAARAEFEGRSKTPGLPPLAERVPEQDRPALRKLMSDAGMTEAGFAGMETWAAALVLSQGVRGPYDPANGIDRALISRFERVEGLESFATQYAIFDKLPEADQRALLAGVVQDAGSAGRGERLEDWLTGNTEGLEAETRSGIMADPGLRQTLLVARNRAWAGEVAGMVQRGSEPLIAVGAAHVVGPDGLPAMLAADGFAVKRLQ